MIIFPAIDIMGGRCVRLTQGKREECIVYSNAPELIAQKWEASGAKWLHIVDLDAALDAVCFANLSTVVKILDSVNIPVQIGGGIRTHSDIEKYLSYGISRVVVGTPVLKSAEFAEEMFRKFGDKTAVSIDSINGKVAVRGWQDIMGLDVIDTAKNMQKLGAQIIIFTDIKRDGMLISPNFDLIKNMSTAVSVQIIASGGFSSNEDIRKVQELNLPNLFGIIVGKALYTGGINLDQIIHASE